MSETLERLRARFPAYTNRSDKELALAIGRKYPQYLARDPGFSNEFRIFQDEQVKLQADAQMDPAEVARRLGFPGAEKPRIGELIEGPSTEEVSKPRLTLSEKAKDTIGLLATLSPSTAPLLATEAGQQIAKGVGSALGGITESMTSDAGIAGLAAATVAPAFVLPVVTVEGVTAGKEQLAQGAEQGDLSKMAEGATTIAASVAPLATVALKAGTARLTTEAAKTAELAKSPAKPPGLPQEAPTAAKTSEPPPLPAEGVAKPVEATKLMEQQPATTAAPESSSSSNLGITPSPLLARIVERLTPANKDVPQPAVALDTSTIAPDFQPYTVSQQVAIRPNNLGRVPGLAWIFDPRSRASSPLDQAVVTHAFESSIGRAVSSSLGQQIKGSIDSPFTVEGSRITNIRPRDPADSTFIEDFFRRYQENPDAYELTLEQKAAADKAVATVREITALERRNGVTPELAGDESNYFPRIRILTAEEKAAAADPLRTGGAIGAKQFFQKRRLFKTEREGVEEGGVTYEPSIERRLVTRLERTYKAIADKRLVESEPLASMGEGFNDRQARYRAQFEHDIAEGRMTLEDVDAITSTLRPDESFVNQPAFANKVYPAEVANVLNRVYGQQTSRTRRAVAAFNTGAKSVAFGIDWAAPFLQGQQLLFSNPTLWAKATAQHYRAFLRPDTMTRFLRDPENLTALRELSQLGVQVAQLEEFTAGIAKGQPLQNFLRSRGAPGIKQVGQASAEFLEAFARSFQTFTEVATVELWKAVRETTPREQWPATAEAIQNTLSRGRMEEIGVTPGQALLERVVFLAPSYLRGGAANLANLVQPGVSGALARKSIASWMTGGTIASVGLMRLAGLDWDEITERLNPMNANWMMIPVKFADGRVRNIGLGGPLRSYLRLAGEIIEAVIDGRDDTTVSEKFVHWFRGKMAPVPGVVWDSIKGQDFLGNDITPWQALKARVMPLSLQQLVQRPGEPPATLGDVLPSVLGVNVWPENITASFERARQQAARESGYDNYERAPLAQQFRITHELLQKPEFRKTPAPKAQIQRAEEADAARRERLLKALPEEQRATLKRLGLNTTGYDPAIAMGRGATLPLTKPQTERYEALIVEEYQFVLARLFEGDRLERLQPSTRQDVLISALTAAKQKARGRLMREMGGSP